jgi:hypothetical protein
VWLEVAYFSGLGALIVFLGALALGRVSVRSLRDVQYARRPVTGPAQVVVPEETMGAATEPTKVSRHAQPDSEPDGTHRRGLFRRHRETAAAGR